MYRQLSDRAIIEGFRRGDSDIISEYFYGYCDIGYRLFDQRYQLSEKENLDFMSLAHQYAIYLMEHNWKPLEDRSDKVSLKTWFINGFRFVVLDALKWYRKEYGSITFEDYLQTFNLDGNLRLHFNKVVEDLCKNAPLSYHDRLIIDMMLLRGFKGKEIALELGMTPSAISQRYNKLKEKIIVPYFKSNFDMDFETPEVIDEQDFICKGICVPAMSRSMSCFDEYEIKQKRITPDHIKQLEPNEIFVFGSNLKGLHGGGTAYIAYSKFGAIMGQGVGLQGKSYAIPTMQGGVDTIRPYVDEFIRFAKENRNLTFLVTRIGCGIAGFTDKDIAPLFKKGCEVDNIILPAGWSTTSLRPRFSDIDW